MVFTQTVPTIERFKSKVRIEENGCHTWTSGKSKSGYGKFYTGHSTTHRAHRWIYEYEIGPIPAGLQVDHTCNNRACVNVEHLRVVTPRENSHAPHSNATARLNAAKTHCLRGHPLEGENLVASAAKRGERSCYSCLIARGRGKYRDRPADWWIGEADRIFSELAEVA